MDKIQRRGNPVVRNYSPIGVLIKEGEVSLNPRHLHGVLLVAAFNITL